MSVSEASFAVEVFCSFHSFFLKVDWFLFQLSVHVMKFSRVIETGRVLLVVTDHLYPKCCCIEILVGFPILEH